MSEKWQILRQLRPHQHELGPGRVPHLHPPCFHPALEVYSKYVDRMVEHHKSSFLLDLSTQFFGLKNPPVTLAQW